MHKQVRIATRGSKLALAQAELVVVALQAFDPEIKCIICPIDTTGDKLLEQDLSTMGGKGLFLKEIEQSLLAKECDIAVHSMKDVPVELPAGLVMAAMLARADPCDALLSVTGHTIASLANGASVGTSSNRRSTILKALRPDLNILPVRGNIGSRINKMQLGQYDAIILAVCGLQRAHLTQVPHIVIPVETMVPAIGQGAIGIECRQDDPAMLALLKQINHVPTMKYVSVERDFMRYMGADCTTPIGGYASEHKDGVQLRTYYDGADGCEKTKVFVGPAAEVALQAVRYYEQHLITTIK